MSRMTASNAQQIKYYWKGEPKMDTEGIYYDSVSIVRPTGSFMLKQFDTVQLEAPEDDKPYVGTILRLYEAENKKKTADVEWFFLKDEILEFSPKNHKNQHIEDKEVFLAEGEVEVVDNVLGSIRNPCYIVYLSPQDSLIETNQKAMVKCPFFQLYFCRYSYNESKNTTFPISAAWRQNKFIVKHWADLPEDMKTFIRYELNLPCFKNLPAVAPKAAASTTADKSAAAKIKKESTASTATSAAGATNNTATATTSTKASSDRKSIGSVGAVSDKNKDNKGASAKKATTAAHSSAPVKAESKPSKTVITPDQVSKWDVIELAKRLSYQDVSSSESDSSSDDSDASERPTRPVKSESELILSRWQDLTDRKRKLYITNARAMKEKFSGPQSDKPPTPKAASPARKHATAKGGIKQETSPNQHTKEDQDSTSGSDNGSGTSSDSEASTVSASAFDDVDRDTYQALRAELALPSVRDETIAYKLFCYDLAQNDSDSSDSSSSEEEVRYLHYGKKAVSDPAKPAVVRTAEEKARDKAARREAELEKQWSDVSFRKMVTYVRRAQRLSSYHAFLQRHPAETGNARGASNNNTSTVQATGGTSKAAPVSTRGSRSAPVTDVEAKPKELSEEDALYANILAAMDAGAEEYDLAFLWMCVDLANGVQNAGDASSKGSNSGSTSSGTENAVMEGQFLRSEWANLTDRKRGYYYERVRQLRDTYRPNSTSKISGSSHTRRSTAAPASPTPTRPQMGRSRAASVTSNRARGASKTVQRQAPLSSDSSSESDNTLEQMAVPQNDDKDGISADLMHAIKSGMGRYEIALQLLAADLSSSDESDSSSEEEVVTRKRMSTGSMKTQPAVMSYKPKKSFQSEMDKIVLKFSDISQRSKNAYMVRAKELQELYGNGEDEDNTTSIMAGRSSKHRPPPASISTLPKPVQLPSASANRAATKNASVSVKRERRDPSQDVSTNNILDKPRTRRPSMDYAVPSLSKPRRHSTGASLPARSNDTKARSVQASKVAPPLPSSALDSDSESDLESLDEEEVQEKPLEPRTDWRAAKKLRLEQAAASRKVGRDRYRRATQEAAMDNVRSSGRNKVDAAHSAAVPDKTRPVHALIPAHLMRPQQQGSEDSDSLESVDDEPARKQQQGRRNSRYSRATAASDGENSGIEEFTEEATLSKRSRQRNGRYSEPTPKARRLSISGTGTSTMQRRASLASVASEDASEDGDSDAGTEDLEQALQVQVHTSRYGTRARGIALGDKADIHGEFLLHASPKSQDNKRNAYMPRVGEDFQADVPSVQEFEQQRQVATEGARSMVTRGSSVGSTLYWGASTLPPSPGLATAKEDPNTLEGIITAYLSRAWVIVDRLKAEKLSEYYQAQRDIHVPPVEPKEAGTESVEGQMEVEGEAKSDETEKPPATALKHVDVIDKSFVTVNKEVEELLLNNLFSSNGDIEAALERVKDLLASQLVLWTAAEQLAITQAFEKFGMNRRSLRNAVPEKSFGEVWDYTLRFLASAVELEDNTTYTDCYGTERCLPQPAAHSNDSEETIRARGNDFIKRLSVSIDETSFWQFLFVLSSAMKAGEGTPAQLVVKLHYVLNNAEYMHVTEVTEVQVSCEDVAIKDAAKSAIAVETDQILDQVQGQSQDQVQAQENQANLTMDGRTDNSTVLSGAMVFDASEPEEGPTTLETASDDSETVKAAGTELPSKQQQVDSEVPRYRNKAEAIQDFNQFLPVMVGRP